MRSLLNFYRGDSYWVSSKFDTLEESRSYYYYNNSMPPEAKELIELTDELANGAILSNEELSREESLRFCLILDACNQYIKNGYERKKVTKIANKYKDEIIRLSKDKNITKNLNNSHKRILRKLKNAFDPTSNLNYIEFKDYSNPLAIIAFINGHITSQKRLTQQRAAEILKKVLIEDIPTEQISKAKTLLLFCVNNFAPYLNKISKKKLLKFILTNMPEPNEMFFDFVKKYPNDYTGVLFDKEFFIKKFDKFSNREIELLINGIEDKKEAYIFLSEKLNRMADRLYLKPNSGGCRVFFKHLLTSEYSDLTPDFGEMVTVLENINYNLESLRKELK